MILAIEVRIFWVVVRESGGSSASPPSSGIESSPDAWPVALLWLRVSDVVDVSRMLGWCPPGHISVALSCLVSLSYPLAVVVIRQNVLLQFSKKFLNCLGLLSCEVGSCWPWGETFDQCLDRCLVISVGDLRPLLHEPSHEVPQWFSVLLLAVIQI
jgi:hypothetical protein